jgi:hypothetical protein
VAKKQIKVGVRQGGPAPGFKWNVYILDLAFKEADALYNRAQYRHLALQVQELAQEDDPTHSQTADVRPIEDYHEIRDRGGVLNNLNARVFFGLDKGARAIVVLGTIHKQNNGPTPNGDRIRIRRRWRKYRNGEYGRVDG